MFKAVRGSNEDAVPMVVLPDCDLRKDCEEPRGGRDYNHIEDVSVSSGVLSGMCAGLTTRVQLPRHAAPTIITPGQNSCLASRLASKLAA